MGLVGHPCLLSFCCSGGAQQGQRATGGVFVGMCTGTCQRLVSALRHPQLHAHMRRLVGVWCRCIRNLGQVQGLRYMQFMAVAAYGHASAVIGSPIVAQ